MIHPDFSQPYILSTDTFGFYIKGILSERPIEQDRPIDNISRVLRNAVAKYAAYELEASVIVRIIRYF